MICHSSGQRRSVRTDCSTRKYSCADQCKQVERAMLHKRTKDPKNTNEQSRLPQPTGMQLCVVFCTNTRVLHTNCPPVSSWTNTNIMSKGRKQIHSMYSNDSVKCIYLTMWHMTHYYIYANYKLNVSAVIF